MRGGTFQWTLATLDLQEMHMKYAHIKKKANKRSSIKKQKNRLLDNGKWKEEVQNKTSLEI